MCAKLVGWGLPCCFFRGCVVIMSCDLFGRDCFLFSKDKMTSVCPSVFFFWLHLLFLVSEILCLYFAMPKIPRLQAWKSSRKCLLSMQLGDVFILLIWTVEAQRTAGCSWQPSLYGFLFGFWPYKHDCPNYAVCLTESLAGAKDILAGL